MRKAYLAKRRGETLHGIEKHVKRLTGKPLIVKTHKNAEIQTLYLLEAIEAALGKVKRGNSKSK